jgi:hypothetical protein
MSKRKSRAARPSGDGERGTALVVVSYVPLLQGQAGPVFDRNETGPQSAASSGRWTGPRRLRSADAGCSPRKAQVFW